MQVFNDMEGRSPVPGNPLECGSMKAEPLERIEASNPILVGTACGVVSSIGYTAANIYLRKLAGDVDPVWISCIKAVPVAIVAWALIVHRSANATLVWLPSRDLVRLVLAAIAVQLGGNVAFQWTLGVIGLAMTVPLMFGSLIIFGALMGRIFLREPITNRSAVSMILLIVAICVLSLGAEQAHASVAAQLRGLAQQSPWLLAAAVGAACVAGLAYAMIGVVMRGLLRERVPIATTLVVISTTGVIVLGTVSLGRLGPSGLLSTEPWQLFDMLIAGTFNMVAFFALSKSLQLIPVVHANALNASQAALAGVAGVVIFGEALSASLVAGAFLTVIGLIAVQGGHR